MSGKNSFQSEKSIVSVEDEAKSLLRELASPAVPGELVCAAVSRAARRAGLSASRVSKIWYGNARAILAVEMDQMRSRAQAMRESNGREDRKKASDVLCRLATLELGLAAIRRELARAQAVDTGGSARDGGAGAS